MENNQTAIEWLVSQVEDFHCLLPVDMIEQAKQMEKEHIMMAYIDGRINQGLKQSKSSEQYYNETYKQQDNGK